MTYNSHIWEDVDAALALRSKQIKVWSDRLKDNTVKRVRFLFCNDEVVATAGSLIAQLRTKTDNIQK